MRMLKEVKPYKGKKKVMGWKEEYEAEQKRVKTELDMLIKTYPLETLEKRFLINFGCINGFGEKAMHELMLARAFHKYHKKLNPSAHTAYEKEPYRCYHVTGCSCGFCEACDSSD